MHRVARGGRVKAGLAPFTVLVIATATPYAALAKSVRFLAFNALPNAAYDARLNGASVRTIASSQAGSLDYTFEASTGQRVSFAPANLSPPPAPILTTVVPSDADCARATWLASGDPTVVGYVIYAGTRSVAAGEAARYDTSVNSGGPSGLICSLAPGVHYVAVRAMNYAGVLSAYSAEMTATILPTLAVLISSFVAEIRDAGVKLSWEIEADEIVQGYRIYRNVEGEPATAIVEDLLPAQTREFLDENARSATSYQYVLAAVREDGSEIRSAPVPVATPALALALGQNSPNPFNPATRIPITLDRATRTVVRIYDVRGALVATVFDGTLGVGRHVMSWSGEDDAGRPVASGVYLYTLTSDRRMLSKKMTLLK